MERVSERKSENIKEGYVNSDTFFARLLPRVRTNETLEFVIRKSQTGKATATGRKKANFSSLSSLFVLSFFFFFFFFDDNNKVKPDSLHRCPFFYHGSLITSPRQSLIIPRRMFIFKTIALSLRFTRLLPARFSTRSRTIVSAG